MSKVGKKSILLPAGVKADRTAEEVRFSGPKGAIAVPVFPVFEIKISNDTLQVIPKEKKRSLFALWGTQRALLQNAAIGVSSPFAKRLIIEGIGYGAQIQGKNLQLKIGYIHPVLLQIPEGIEAKTEKNVITISGIDKAAVGQFAALIKKQKPPEPYKGKGIRYENEVIRRKAGKKVAGTTA